MPKKKHKAGRPKRGSTSRRDAIEGIELELIALTTDADEIETRIRQALRRTPLVADVLGPAMDRIAQMQQSIALVKAQSDVAWEAEQKNWRSR